MSLYATYFCLYSYFPSPTSEKEDKNLPLGIGPISRKKSELSLVALFLKRLRVFNADICSFSKLSKNSILCFLRSICSFKLAEVIAIYTIAITDITNNMTTMKIPEKALFPVFSLSYIRILPFSLLSITNSFLLPFQSY